MTAGAQRHYPPRPIAGVAAVIWKDDRFLLVRRRNDPLSGRWSLPGGMQHLGETVGAAIKRELLEECGIDVSLNGLVDVVDLIFKDEGGGIRHHYVVAELTGEWLYGEARAGTDASEIAWAELAQMQRFLLDERTKAVVTKSAGLRKPEPERGR
jgi:ADP-ribose pyrophosphatase YjhB (NUDIX family)